MKLISQILHPYKATLGQDFEAYLHHAQRVYQYASTLLLVRESKKIAIAAAFHDLDIWVSNDMDYLKNSAALAGEYIKSRNIDLLVDEVRYIIKNHHKLRKINDHPEAEAFRRADLIDLTSGMIKYNLPQSLIDEAERKYPRVGFTKLITKKCLRYALRHPLRPLPMVRW